MASQEKKILSIDDNKDILYTLEQICRFQGWTPLTAEGYEAAQEILKKQNPDLILVDYHMPGMDGVSTVKELRKQLPNTPIVVLTIEESDEVLQKFMRAGADDYALKPIKALDLISRIRVHLQFSERNRFYQGYDKGISRGTLAKIEEAMRGLEGYRDIYELESITEIKKEEIVPVTSVSC